MTCCDFPHTLWFIYCDTKYSCSTGYNTWLVLNRDGHKTCKHVWWTTTRIHVHFIISYIQTSPSQQHHIFLGFLRFWHPISLCSQIYILLYLSICTLVWYCRIGGRRIHRSGYTTVWNITWQSCYSLKATDSTTLCNHVVSSFAPQSHKNTKIKTFFKS